MDFVQDLLFSPLLYSFPPPPSPSPLLHLQCLSFHLG